MKTIMLMLFGAAVFALAALGFFFLVAYIVAFTSDR
jgi:hypothetical protein